METAVLVDKILQGPTVEGVTFLGGEPFAQASAVAEIAEAVQAAGLSVVTFTGYLFKDIDNAGRPDYSRLLVATDLLIDGPFEREKIDFSRPWTGSSNQQYHFLTERYASMKNDLPQIPNQLEIRIGHDGNIITGGIAPFHEIENLLKGISRGC